MDIKLFGLVKESVVDGDGMRMTIFVQGCPHRCEGCHNPASHDFDGGYLSDTDDIMDEYKKNVLLDGVTFTGGEPFCSSEPLLQIAKQVHALGGDVWCYSGYTFEQLLSDPDPKRQQLLNNIDVLVDGKFEQSNRTLMLKFRGSKNQRILDVKKSLKNSTPVWLDGFTPNE